MASGRWIAIAKSWGAVTVVLAPISLGACASQPGEVDEGESVGAARAAVTGPAISQYAVLARHGITFKDRVFEIGGGIGVAAGAGSSLNTLKIGFDARVAIGQSIAAPRVVLAARTTVGSVFATQIDASGATIAARAPFAAPPAIPTPGAVSPGTQVVNVALDQIVTLASGKFGAVTVADRGTLTLSGGLYQFSSLKLGNDTRLLTKGTVIVKVAGAVTALDRVQLLPASPLKARDLRFEIGGPTGSGGNGLTFGNDCRFTALFVAQRGVLAGDRLIASGAIAAEDVALGIDSRLTFDSGFGCASEADCGSNGTCVAGSCADTAQVACQASNISRVAVEPGQPFDVATNGTRLYWTDTAAGAIKSSAINGTGATTLLTGIPGVSGLAVDSSFVYYADVLSKTVSRFPTAGGPPEILAANQHMPRFLVSDGDSLFWTNQGTGNSDGSVRRLTKSTGVLDSVADRQPGPWTLSAAGGRVSWSDVVSGSVLTRSSIAAPIKTLAAGLRQPAIAGASATPHLLSADGRLYDYNAGGDETTPRAIFEGGGFFLANVEPSLFWTNGVRQLVTKQASPNEFPSTIWRRPGTGSPRVIRAASNAVWFTVTTSSGPGSVFTFTPEAAPEVGAGSPACAPGDQGATCDLTALPVTPVLNCVAETSDHRLVAHFGFTNQDKSPRRVGVGPENQFDRSDPDACQPTTFTPGTRNDVFAVGFVEELTWTVGSRSVTASRSSPRCQTGAVRNTEVSP